MDFFKKPLHKIIHIAKCFLHWFQFPDILCSTTNHGWLFESTGVEEMCNILATYLHEEPQT